MMTKIYSSMISRLTYLKNRKGQTLVEYGLILALISIVTIAILTMMGTQLKSIFGRITSTLASAAS